MDPQLENSDSNLRKEQENASSPSPDIPGTEAVARGENSLEGQNSTVTDATIVRVRQRGNENHQQNRRVDQAAPRFSSERRMEKEAPRSKVEEYVDNMLPVVTDTLLKSSDKGGRQCLGVFICLLLLLARISVLDNISRMHAHTSGRRLYRQKLPAFLRVCCYVAFWAFYLFVTYYFVAECLDDTHKWVVYLLPLLIVVWMLCIVVLHILHKMGIRGGQIADGDQMVVEMI
ncbi:hypothetical protein BT69DRAFT_1323516 [Atractiella rhizophila]|nr:hypothetical protein BT69DRAFT_1323516 [Atractiella rhizophila]